MRVGDQSTRYESLTSAAYQLHGLCATNLPMLSQPQPAFQVVF